MGMRSGDEMTPSDILFKRPLPGWNPGMRIILTGDRFWPCHKLIAEILRRLLAKYGPDIVIAHGDDTGVDETVAFVCSGFKLRAIVYPCDWDWLGADAEIFRNREMVRAGVNLCVIVHRALLGKGPKDLARQAIMAGIPTYLIEDERGMPRRLKAGDAT
jgi:YspA, cpYpsA-related SLOG family